MDRQLLYSGPGGQPFDDGSKYNVVCTSGYTSRGIPSYLVSFCCPAQERHGCGPEIFTVQIRKGALDSFLPLSGLLTTVLYLALLCLAGIHRLLGEVTARGLAFSRYAPPLRLSLPSKTNFDALHSGRWRSTSDVVRISMTRGGHSTCHSHSTPFRSS